jgi:hypothetical protein
MLELNTRADLQPLIDERSAIEDAHFVSDQFQGVARLSLIRMSGHL